MGRLDLTTGLVIELFLLQCLDLGFCQDQAALSHFFSNALEPALDVRQIVTQPDAADPAG
jgi:hypothetical protein